MGKGRWIKCEGKQGQDGAHEDGQEPLSVLTGNRVEEVEVLQLVAFIAELTTVLAQECEKLLPDLAQKSLVAHFNQKHSGKGILGNVVQPSQLAMLQSHSHWIPIFENVLVKDGLRVHTCTGSPVLRGDGGLEMDMLGDLESLQFEYGIQEEDRSWLYLQGRSRGLTIKACAHAAFFCKLLCAPGCHVRALEQRASEVHSEELQSARVFVYVSVCSFSRESIHKKQTSSCLSTGEVAGIPSDDALKVGLIGGGHLGKQLARVLLQLVPIPAENLRISTRRPETLDEFQNLGIQCFYHNPHLVDWANVIFLCCLPSQLPNICLEIQTRLEKDCIVYSFVAAIPIARLKLLLNHTNILRPQYQCVEDSINIWGANKDITSALQDPVILQATCPFSSAGGITLNIKWLEGVLYTVLNVCTTRDMPHLQALQLLNQLLLSVHSAACGKDGASCPTLELRDLVSQVYSKNLPHRRPFPWFDLTAVQLKETPFSQHLSASPALQDHLTYRYCDSFGISLTKEQ
ncbi:NADP-dependent oxidoreductase domain-containing protein 1 [Meles meles]|uniref:NADP-dependent oxidoreductase domain-containing protein 1 n=1 Tax=Meles meles TaxID=9662 RepID=UPI001E69A105|nr:NADP-dependent oxidoreductase domain-containing protein 1 [Meles meles]